jgi:hypothetical protein
VQYLVLVITIFEVLEGPRHGNELETSNCKERTMNHAKTSFSTEIFAGAIIVVVQYLAPLWYLTAQALVMRYAGLSYNRVHGSGTYSCTIFVKNVSKNCRPRFLEFAWHAAFSLA